MHSQEDQTRSPCQVCTLLFNVQPSNGNAVGVTEKESVRPSPSGHIYFQREESQVIGGALPPLRHSRNAER